MATTQKASSKKTSSKNPLAPLLEAAIETIEQNEIDAQHRQADAQANAAMAFAVQQLTTPAVSGLQNLVLQAQALAAPKPAKAARVMCVEQNGQKRPLANGGLCDQLWSKADAITAAQNSPCTIAQLTAALPGINMHTVKTQYASWRKFNGVTGRLPTAPKAPKQTQLVMTHEGNP